MNPIFHMFQKELIQHKLVVRMPLFVLIFSLLMIVLFLYGLSTDIEFRMEGVGQNEMLNIQNGYSSFFAFAATLISYLLSIQYLSKAISSDRKEGSLVFWRSMPVSDLSTHLVKLSFALLIIPFLCSLVLLSTEMFIWVISLFSGDQMQVLMGNISIFGVVDSYFSYLFNMLILGFALLPFACLIFALSQLYDSPLLIALIGIYALKTISAALLPNSGVEQFFYQFIHLPTSLAFTSEPIKLISHLPVVNTLLMYVLGVLFLVSSLYIQKHGELNFKELIKQK